MNFKDKYFTTGLILMGISFLGLFFPSLITTLFIVTGIAGLISILYWVDKEK